MNKRFKVFIAKPELSRDELISFINVSIFDTKNSEIFRLTAQRHRKTISDSFGTWYAFRLNADLGLVFEDRKETSAKDFIKAFRAILGKLEKMGASNTCYLRVIESNFDSSKDGKFLDYKRWYSDVKGEII